MVTARQRTLVIGDTPRDIACARADSVRCLAVTTGPYGAQDLEAADGVAHDTGELQRLIVAELDRVAAVPGAPTGDVPSG